ncbi:hypothetical protein [uncultured Campylobacter sp.]|uniref:hypothetical protein n=1 Tax=uncultured Campylobacter sp. TaxID=218934 RepID=UPI002636594D|nr:hypothetical protein [uncultured Campylobacter sp.]
MEIASKFQIVEFYLNFIISEFLNSVASIEKQHERLVVASIFSVRSERSNLEASEVPSLLRWCFHPSQPASSSANTAAATFKFKNFII